MRSERKVGLDRKPGLTKVCYPYVTRGERVNPACPAARRRNR
ncbi:hypothetical protein FTUN_6814 [Frigoriglobus tundricola]|uniref:Uncharacterized protein n=1 Tax=Frigoriglobus tundricola TaxID=2774151 RepID=A0A6M5Z222_9BACT|nr:hypothetical protein FTUN_6814 [Frigoriglobus tundricola]